MYVPPDVKLPTVSGVVSGGLLKKKTKKAIHPGMGSGFTTRSHIGSEYDSRSICSSDLRNSVPVVSVEEPPQPRGDSLNSESIDVPAVESPKSTGNDTPNVESLKSVYEIVEPVAKPATPDDAPPDTIEMVSESEKNSRLVTVFVRKSELEDQKERLSAQLEAMIINQNELCESEKFDEAAALDSEIWDIKHQLLELNQELLIEIPLSIESLRQQAIDLLIGVTGSMNSNLMIKQNELQDVEAQFASDGSQLQAKLKQVTEIDLLFTDKEQDLVKRKKDFEKAKSDLDRRIAEESESIALQKQEAEAEYTVVDQRIEELQRQLAEAMAERSELAMIISGSGLKLSTIRIAYSQELEEVDELKAEIDQAESILVAEKEAAGGGNKSAVEAAIAELKSNQKDTTSTLKFQVDSIRNQISDQEKLFQVQKTWFKSESELLSAVQPIRRKIVESEQYVELLEEQLRDAELKLSSFKENKTEMTLRLPQLEEEKRVAIANRSFKEAKDLTNEIRYITDAIAAVETTQTELRGNVKSARSELGEAVAALDGLKAELNTVEAKFEEDMLSFLTKKLAEISELSTEESSELVRAALIEEQQICKLQLKD